MTADVFISYDHDDKEFAIEFRRNLETFLQAHLDSSIQVWMDDRIPNGAYWRDEIDRKLDAASLVIVIVSPASMQSAYVTYEWTYTWFKLRKETYWLYFRRCDETGIFGRLRDFQFPLTACLRPDEARSSEKYEDEGKKLEVIFEEINGRLQELPRFKDALQKLTNPNGIREDQVQAAQQLGQAEYLKLTACNFLLEAAEHQLSGRGNGVVSQAVADALFKVGDKRALPALWRLYRIVGSYEPAVNSIVAALNKLSCD